MNTPTSVELLKADVSDIAELCHAALAQDAPSPATFYLNQILNIVFGYLDSEQKSDLEKYLAEKKYLPPVNLIISND